MMRALLYILLGLLLKHAPLGQHRVGEEKFFGFLCPRCVVAVQRESLVEWRRP